LPASFTRLGFGRIKGQSGLDSGIQIRRASSCSTGRSPRHPYLHFPLSARSQSRGLSARPLACRGALVRGQQGKLPLGFVSYGVVDGNLRESEGRRAWAGWSLREATRRERGACLALVVLVLVGCPPARYRPRRQGIGQILALGAPPRYDSLIPLRRLDDEVCCHGRSRRCALRRACGGAHGSGGRRRRRRGSGEEREG
jgi:hypothetical protein